MTAFLLLFLVGAQPPAGDEPAKLSDRIEQSINSYEVRPDEAADPLMPVPVLRWRNVTRGQEGEAMMVVWPHHGRPAAVASIYPWDGKMIHEFDSLSREAKLTVREKDRSVWSPTTAGVEYRPVPNAPKPAATPAERLRQMKALADGFKATMTGWSADDTDRESLRLLPRPLYRYDLKAADPVSELLDGGLFAFVQGTDPELVLSVEAVGPMGKPEWQYAFVRATSGGLEVKLADAVVWTAKKHPTSNDPTRPHFSAQRPLDK
jgi:hypothetical protein